MVSLKDPIRCTLFYAFIDYLKREKVPYSIKKYKEAGIKVVMITGDHPHTAESVAKQCNIITSSRTANEIAEQEGIPLEDALRKAKSAVVTGDMIAHSIIDIPDAPKSCFFWSLKKIFN